MPASSSARAPHVEARRLAACSGPLASPVASAFSSGKTAGHFVAIPSAYRPPIFSRSTPIALSSFLRFQLRILIERPEHDVAMHFAREPTEMGRALDPRRHQADRFGQGRRLPAEQAAAAELRPPEEVQLLAVERGVAPKGRDRRQGRLLKV